MLQAVAEKFEDYDDATSSDEEAGPQAKLEEYLRCHESFHKETLRHLLGFADWKDRNFGLLLHAALQTLAREGHVFAPHEGVYRLASAKGAHARALRFGRASIAKMDRAVTLAMVASEMASDDPEEARRLERSAMRLANKALNARCGLHMANKPRPKGVKKV